MAKAAKPKTPTEDPSRKPTHPPPAAARAGAEEAVARRRSRPRRPDRRGSPPSRRKDWKKAVELFEQAVEQSDRPEVKDRATQFLTVSRQKVGPARAKPAKEASDRTPTSRRVYEKNRGNLAEALEISRKGGRDQKDERFAYLAASIHAVEDRLDEAAQALARAIELNPKNRIHAFHDPDFAELRKNRDLRPLFGLS